MRVADVADLHAAAQFLETFVDNPKYTELAPQAKIYARMLRRVTMECLFDRNNEVERGRQDQLSSRVERQAPSPT